ncbi:MAG TPA: hypothetical protein PLG79_05575 [Spirochaetales bacterium]|nr:hypothetical protein [Spirochaetales bacterium]
MKPGLLSAAWRETTTNYQDIDRLLTEPEFTDKGDRILSPAEPDYVAIFTSYNLVLAYQRRFLNAAKGQS